ncbi:hypothetical protein [Arsenophonus apicola]|uniref:hypothetical protein n=1 Tax=Arsenophonus apicola TaxID=2879119 RepID=UPI001CDD465C|nr:hypothetical protein [Arsenophonus apicola]UBX30245.1 hypothetical protein LDL57_06505 [Arsenophonus apicola]
MFGALLTAPDGTPWILPQSTPLCLKSIVNDVKDLPGLPDGILSLRFFQYDQQKKLARYYLFTNEEQQPPIGQWGVSFWDENGKCIVHTKSKTLNVKGSLQNISNDKKYWHIRRYKEKIKGSVAVLDTVAGYGFFLVNPYNPEGSNIFLPIYVFYIPYAYKNGSTTEIGYRYEGEDFNYNEILSERFTGIHSRIVYIDTAEYD